MNMEETGWLSCPGGARKVRGPNPGSAAWLTTPLGARMPSRSPWIRTSRAHSSTFHAIDAGKTRSGFTTLPRWASCHTKQTSRWEELYNSPLPRIPPHNINGCSGLKGTKTVRVPENLWKRSNFLRFFPSALVPGVSAGRKNYSDFIASTVGDQWPAAGSHSEGGYFTQT